MKWFKHISDSLDDPFIFSLCDEFGPTGYYVFFGVLEIYSREFKTENYWKLEVGLRYLCTKLVATRKQHVIKILNYCNEKGKFEVLIDKKNVSIYIPKFRKYLDETTLKKLRISENKSGSIPESNRNSSSNVPPNVRTEVEVEVDVEVEEEVEVCNKIPTLTPKDFPVTDKMKKYASKKKFTKNLEDMTEDFLIYHRKKGNKFVCWYSAWQNWLRNQIKFDREKEPSKVKYIDFEELKRLEDAN